MRTENYNIDDLVVNESFIEWVLDPESDDSGYWEQYLSEDINKSLHVKKARSLVIQLNNAKETPTENQKEKILGNIHSQISQEKADKSGVINWAMISKIAAMFVFVISAYFLIDTNDKNEYTTGYNEIQTLDLPDGSQVVLNSNSSIEYASNWDESTEREVWLEGEAYFKVRKTKVTDSKKFVVYTDDLNVKVLGTQFNVNTHEENTAVVLEEGKVDIEIKLNSTDEINPNFSMTPGQKTSFSDSATEYEVSDVNTSVYTSWKDGTIVFDGTPLSDLKNIIENNYGYQVVFESENLLSKKLDGKIDNPNLEKLLSSLETIFNLQIEKKGKQLIIKE